MNTLALLTLAVIIICLLVLFRVVLRRQIAARTAELELQLVSLAAELALAEEKERRRIATVLHDTVCQTLSLSSFKLSSLSLVSTDPDKSKELEEVKVIIDSSIDDLRTLMRQLCTPGNGERIATRVPLRGKS